MKIVECLIERAMICFPKDKRGIKLFMRNKMTWVERLAYTYWDNVDEWGYSKENPLT